MFGISLCNCYLLILIVLLFTEPYPEHIKKEMASKPIPNPRSDQFTGEGDMLKETRELLDEFYAPYNRKLRDVLGDDRFLWSSDEWEEIQFIIRLFIEK